MPVRRQYCFYGRAFVQVPWQRLAKEICITKEKSVSVLSQVEARENQRAACYLSYSIKRATFVCDFIFKLKLIAFFLFFFYRNRLKFTSANLEEKYATNGIRKVKLGNRSGSLDKLAEQIVFMHLRAIRELGR